MAAVAVIFGGMTGFVSALLALVLFNSSWLMALALWALGGIAVAGLLVALALSSRQPKSRLLAETV